MGSGLRDTDRRGKSDSFEKQIDILLVLVISWEDFLDRTLHFCSVRQLVSLSVYLSLIGVFTHTHAHLQALGHKRRSVWKMKLFYVNRLLSLRRLHITSVTTNLPLSLSRFPSHFLAHLLLSHLFLTHSPPSLFPLSPHLPRFCLSLPPLLYSLSFFCCLSPPHRRGEWISKLIPDSCSGW